MRFCTRKFFALIAACLAGATVRTASAADAPADFPPVPPPAQILEDLHSFASTGRVLMVAAHPDDENTQLITYLARGRHYAMAYLSVTRGDGGQNVLGPEFGPELGLIRTHELLAARALDGGRQFFTRALDFGFSKNPTETLNIWNTGAKDAVLSDVVRVIRRFRPDVIVTRFGPDQTNTHGHHTASAILALAAFKLSGDANAFPEQLEEGLAVWQPKRIVYNGGFGGPTNGAPVVRMDVSGTDPVLNMTYGDIATRSRAMHKSQGFDNIGGGGGRGGGRGPGGPRAESFQLLAGDPAVQDLMDGIDTTLARFSGGAPVATAAADAVAKFNPNDPAASAPALLEIKKELAALAPDPVFDEKKKQLDRLIANCIGLSVRTTIPRADVTPGETIQLHPAALVGSNIPVQWAGVRDAAGAAPARELQAVISLSPGQPMSREMPLTISPTQPVSQAYWRRESPLAGTFRVQDSSMIGLPENPPVVPLEQLFSVGGQTIALDDEPVQMIPSAPAPQQLRPLTVIAPVSFSFPYDVALFWQNPRQREYHVEITAARPNVSGTVRLDAPAGWRITTGNDQTFHLANAGDKATCAFVIKAPDTGGTATLTAWATIDGQRYSTQRKEIAYDHIPRLLLQPSATVTAVALDLQNRVRTVGYLPGAGDSTVEALEQMGVEVKTLTTADLTDAGLKGLNAIVIGVRAFNVRADLAPDGPALKALFDYANNGGTVVEQYNRPDQLRNTTLAPYPIHLSTLRVTDETAKMAFLAPDNAVLNTPNKITDADFDNWVQERSIYLPDQWDSHFVQVLGAADPGETPPNSALLVADCGKGHWVYTSLVFFRQLPAGNPGAYRLFANLISLGKQ